MYLNEHKNINSEKNITVYNTMFKIFNNFRIFQFAILLNI